MGQSQRQRDRRKQKYRDDPAYRAKRLAQSKAYHASWKSDPDYQRLIALRKDIHRFRESREKFLERAAGIDAKLVAAAREMVQAQRRWDRKRRARATGRNSR